MRLPTSGGLGMLTEERVAWDSDVVISLLEQKP